MLPHRPSFNRSCPDYFCCTWNDNFSTWLPEKPVNEKEGTRRGEEGAVLANAAQICALQKFPRPFTPIFGSTTSTTALQLLRLSFPTVNSLERGRWGVVTNLNCLSCMDANKKQFSETEMFSWSAQFEEMAIIRSYSWKYHSCPFPLWQGRWEIWLEMVRHADFTCFTRQLGLLLLPQWTQSA